MTQLYDLPEDWHILSTIPVTGWRVALATPDAQSHYVRDVAFLVLLTDDHDTPRVVSAYYDGSVAGTFRLAPLPNTARGDPYLGYLTPNDDRLAVDMKEIEERLQLIRAELAELKPNKELP